MTTEGFSAAFCGSSGDFATDGGLPTFCSLESAWLAVYAVFFLMLVERYAEIYRMAVSCPPARLPVAFLVKQASTGYLSVAYLVLLAMVAGRATARPPVVVLSLLAHAVLWGMTHCLLRMEFRRFLPQCRLSVRGFWSAGGVEGVLRLFFIVVQHNTSTTAYLFTFGEFLKTNSGLSSPVYFAARLIYGSTSAFQVLLFAVCFFHPNDLPMELLPFVARLLAHGSATLPCYTPPQPARCSGVEKATVCVGPSREVLATGRPSSVSASAGEGFRNSLVVSSPPPTDLLDISILNVVLTEVQLPSVVHAEYKLEIRSAGRAAWTTRKRFRSFVELSQKLHAAFPAFLYPELAAVVPRLPPRDHFSDHQLSLQYLELRRRGLESFLKAVVSERAFWISDFLTFLEVPEDLRPALSTQRLVRLSELQHPSQRSASFLAVHRPESAPVAPSRGSGCTMIPVLHSPTPQGTAQWFTSAASRGETFEETVTASSSSAWTAEIWRLRVCREDSAPFVVHDILCSTHRGVFFRGRRYKEFVQLLHKLRRELCVSLPRLPGRLVSSKRDYLFHEQRKAHLEMWLKQILADGACARSPTLWAFLGVADEDGNLYEESNSMSFAHDAEMKRIGRLPLYMISVASFKQSDSDKFLRLLVLRSDGNRERHWEVVVTERQVQALHAELCRTFNSHDIRLVPDIPHKRMCLIATTPESLQASYELYLGELCRNYPTFSCKALEDFLCEPVLPTPPNSERTAGDLADEPEDI